MDERECERVRERMEKTRVGLKPIERMTNLIRKRERERMREQERETLSKKSKKYIKERDRER